MIYPETIFPTHSDLAVAVGGHGIYMHSGDKKPTLYAVKVALQGTATMLVKIPYNQQTIPQIKKLQEAVVNSPTFVCGIRFENLVIRQYQFTDYKTNKISTGYTATATDILEIIP